MSEMLDRIRMAKTLTDRLTARPVRIRFNSKHDVIHMLDEPEIRSASPEDLLLGIPVVFDSDVPPREYRIDW